jgi:V8-like Glu-specific endopeptidase
MIGHNIRDAQENEYSYVVSLMQIDCFLTNPQYDHICTGTLVTRKDVVTSEHCVQDRELDDTKLMVGAVNLWQSRSYNILWWISYEQWAVSHNIVIEFDLNDVAVIRVIES